MVIDKMEHAARYYGLGERFQKALDWLAHADPAAMISGQRVNIDGDAIYATLFDTETLPPENCVLEGHRNYADIQYLVRGTECMGYMLDGPVVPVGDYDAQKDVQFFRGDWDTLTVRAGTFYIVWPQDLHAPRVVCGTVCPVVRLVAKVKL